MGWNCALACFCIEEVEIQKCRNEAQVSSQLQKRWLGNVAEQGAEECARNGLLA